MRLPEWAGAYASLDDETLAELTNPGLVRRGRRLAAAVVPVRAGPDEIMLTCQGVEVRLRPGGVRAARCPCPAPGLCVHIVAGCLWAGQAASAAGATAGTVAETASETTGTPAGTTGAPAGATEPTTGTTGTAGPPADPVNGTTGTPALAVEPTRSPSDATGTTGTPAGTTGASAGATEPTTGTTTPGTSAETTAPTVAPAEPTVGTTGTHAGATEPSTGTTRTSTETTAETPGTPAETTAPAVSPAEPTVGVTARPPRSDPTAAQGAAAAGVAAVVEGLLAQGLEQAVGADIDRLTRAGQRARLADLRLLARLAAAAAGGLRALTGRADDTTASAVLSALAQAWACAQAVSSGTVAAAGEAAALPQRLIPLAARWGHAPSGTRSFTLHAWDPDARRLEQAANGRAAGADPGFVRSWDAPLLWKASAARLCSGMLTVHNPSRRDDGSLAASSGTAVTAGGWDGVDLAELAGQVNSADNGLARTQFGAGSEPLRILLPKRSFGLGALELDEIAQELVWPVTDRTGQTHRLALPADEVNAQLLTWLVQESKLTAITSVGGRPEAVFLLDKKGLRLVSLTLTPLPLRQLEPKWRRRLLGLDRQRRAAGPEPEPDRLRRLCAALGDLVDDLAASGQHSLGPHHLDTLTRRAQELDDLGLATPAAAAVALLDQVTPARLLWAKLIFDRVTVLLG